MTLLWHEPLNLLAVAIVKPSFCELLLLEDGFDDGNFRLFFPLSVLQTVGWHDLGAL